jgi:hypothetical protein
MSNATLLTPFAPLSINEAAVGDFNYVAILKSTDLAGLAGSVVSNQTWNLMNLPAGAIVASAAIVVITPFVFSNASIIITNLGVGDGSSGTTYFATKNVAGTGQTTPIAAGACYLTTTGVAYPVTTNSQLSCILTVTTSQALNTCTAGEARILFSVRNLLDFGYSQSN